MPPRLNRRTTLGAVTENKPVLPGTGVKPRGSRTSMIPRVGRENSIPQTPAASRVNNRRKTLGVNPSPSTVTTPSSGNQRQQNNKDRRQSLLAPTVTAKQQDTRSINDKAFQKDCIQKILHYLVQNGYNHPVSLKTLARPSGRDFALIITFMLRKVDPWFQTATMKFEDEVATTFKSLGYPFPVSKTALVAAGSPHTWPALLAALTWLVDYLDADYYEIDEEDDEEEGFESLEELEVRMDCFFFKYLGAAYVAFMRTDVDLSERLETELQDRFEHDDGLIEREAERVLDLNASVCEALELLTKEENDIPAYYNKREKYAADVEQLHDLIAQMDERKITYESKISSRRAELEATNRTLEQLNAKVNSLIETVKLQKLSVADAEKIEEDCKGIEEAIERKVKTKSQLGESQAAVDNEVLRLFKQLSSKSKKYNAAVSEISAFSFVKEMDVNMNVSINPTEDASARRVIDVDPRFTVLPTLLKLKNECLERIESMKLKKRDTLSEMDAIEEALSAEASNIHLLQVQMKEFEERTALEQQKHAAKVGALSKELEILENKVAMLRDPSAIDEQYAHIEWQCAQLEALRSKHQDETILKKQIFLQELNAACQAITDYEEYYLQKMAECQEYKRKKAANKPALNVPDEFRS